MQPRTKRRRLLESDSGSVDVPPFNFVSFSSIYSYIRLNPLLPKLSLRIRPNHHDLNELLHAIKTGDHTSSVFSNPNCYLYLLNLINTNQVSQEAAMTVYAYLLALAQYTNQQRMKSEDSDVKSPRRLEIVKMAAEGQLTLDGQRYVALIAERFKHISVDINTDVLTQFIVNLPAIEQWLLCIQNYTPLPEDLVQLDSLNKYRTADSMKAILALNLPFVSFRSKSAGSNFDAFVDSLHRANDDICVPSTSIIQYLLRIATPSPITILPIFGQVGIETLHTMHAHRQHPAAIYDTRVKSNLYDADGYRAGPYVAWLHDVGHAYFGSLLSPEEHDCLFNKLIPLVRLAKTSANESGQSKQLVDLLSALIICLGDLDLSGEIQYVESTERFYDYLRHCLKLSRQHEQYAGYRPLVDFFLLMNLTANDVELSSFDKNCIKFIMPSIFHLIHSYHRSDSASLGIMISALLKISDCDLLSDQDVANLETRFGVKLHQVNDDLVDLKWADWERLVNSDYTNEELFEVILQTKEKEFYTLILRYGFRFYHPVIPLTDEVRQSLRSLIDLKLHPVISGIKSVLSGGVALFGSNSSDARTKPASDNHFAAKKRLSPY